MCVKQHEPFQHSDLSERTYLTVLDLVPPVHCRATRRHLLLSPSLLGCPTLCRYLPESRSKPLQVISGPAFFFNLFIFFGLMSLAPRPQVSFTRSTSQWWSLRQRLVSTLPASRKPLRGEKLLPLRRLHPQRVPPAVKRWSPPPHRILMATYPPAWRAAPPSGQRHPTMPRTSRGRIVQSRRCRQKKTTRVHRPSPST